MMPGKTDKRKEPGQDSGDEIQLGCRRKSRRTGYVISSANVGCARPESEIQDPSCLIAKNRG